MPFYKILTDGKVLDVNSVFLRWQPRHGVMMLCEPHKGEFICPRDNSAYYHPAWLNEPPPGAVYAGDIECVEIDEAEYKALLEQLDAGKAVEEEPPAPEESTAPASTNEQTDPHPAQPTVADFKMLLEEVGRLREIVEHLKETQNA